MSKAADTSRAGERASHWVGFDLGGTKMLGVVFDADFQVLARAKKRTNSQRGMEAGLARITDVIRTVLDKAGIDAADLGGIGIGSPGPLDLDRGVIIDTPNLGWQMAPLKDTLEDAFRCATVVLNDVDAGVYGEYRFGAGRKARCVLGVFPGTGVGGGCVYEGQILRGSVQSVMEIGHIRVLPRGPRCGCGGRGCLEAVASRLVVSAAAAAAAHRGEAPHLLAAAGMDLSLIRSSTLAAAVAAGDKAVEDIVRDAARWLGVAVGSVINLLGPEIVVLGGGLVEALPELITAEVRRAARKSVMPSFRDTFEVVPAALGDDATAAGAAAWAAHAIGTSRPESGRKS